MAEAYVPPATASWMPCRAERNAVLTNSFGSAVRDEVSDATCTHSTGTSRITSCTANAPEDASPSMISSQPSLLIRSRVTFAASSGRPLLARSTNSSVRPPMPPASFTRLNASCTA